MLRSIKVTCANAQSVRFIGETIRGCLYTAPLHRGERLDIDVSVLALPLRVQKLESSMMFNLLQYIQTGATQKAPQYSARFSKRNTIPDSIGNGKDVNANHQ